MGFPYYASPLTVLLIYISNVCHKASDEMEETLKISLVMATAGRADEIRRFILSLENQTSSAFELIVVDQNDDDRLAPIVARVLECGMDITHLKHPVKSLSGARNVGTAIARYDLIAYPDDDCWYDDRVVEGILSRFEQDRGLDGIVARWDEEDPFGKGSQTLSLSESRRFRGVQPSSITIFVKKDLVLKIGGFDERLGVPCWYGSGEETDLVMRCLEQGATIRYMPDIIVHHAYGPDMSQDLHQICARTRNRARGTGALYARHWLSPRVVVRGLLSPLMKVFFPPYSVRRIVANLCMILGRIEGLVSWLVGMRKDRKSGDHGL